MNLYRRLIQILLLLLSVVALGTAGYALIEHFSLFDALYMTVITVASVGYGEIPRELSTAGRAFTMVLIVVGLGSMAYGLSAITAFWVEGDISHVWEKRKMEGRIAKLRDHIVVCGGGQTGRHIAGELLGTRTPFICIERNVAEEDAIRKLDRDMVYMIGDATDADVLRAARIEAARGLIACMPSDKDNLFTLLTARELNPSMRIVSRLIADESRPQLIRAGADVVVSVPTIGALRLASEMLRPHVVGFIDAMLREPGAIRVQEIPIGARAVGQRLGSLQLQERAGIVVFALRDGASRRFRYNPAPDYLLGEGDVLIACADPDQVAAAKTIVADA